MWREGIIKVLKLLFQKAYLHDYIVALNFYSPPMKQKFTKQKFYPITYC